jgi:Cu-processing system permease protein
MLSRIFAIAMNTYREAVRARVLFGLLAAALAASSYSLVIASMSLREEQRVVADLGSASISAFAVLVAVVLGATSLYRELELKTVFPILTRQLRRHEYVLGKYFGILAVLLAFVAMDGAAVLTMLALQARVKLGLTLGCVGALLAALALGLWRSKRSRVFFVLPWALGAFVMMALVASHAGQERQLVVASAVLTMAEVAIVTAIALFFSSFSSPALTAVFTFMLFLIGRSADTLGNLPARTFGEAIRKIGIVLARGVPNLHLYVAPRPVLLGQVPSTPIGSYLASTVGNAALYALVLLSLSALIFRKRDFT